MNFIPDFVFSNFLGLFPFFFVYFFVLLNRKCGGVWFSCHFACPFLLSRYDFSRTFYTIHFSVLGTRILRNFPKKCLIFFCLSLRRISDRKRREKNCASWATESAFFGVLNVCEKFQWFFSTECVYTVNTTQEMTIDENLHSQLFFSPFFRCRNKINEHIHQHHGKQYTHRCTCSTSVAVFYMDASVCWCQKDNRTV